MFPFYSDLKNVPRIQCNIDLLKSYFPDRENIYFHTVFTEDKSLWLSDNFEYWLKSLGLFVIRSDIFHTNPNRLLGWHTDMNPPKPCVKINWVYEDGISYIEWGDLPTNIPTISTTSEHGRKYLGFDPLEIEPVCKYHLKGPTLFNAGYPHRVDNRKETDRWALSNLIGRLDDKSWLLWEDAVKIFKNYLV